jgi:predicted glycosyl hydrolase (DUF1957 family)
MSQNNIYITTDFGSPQAKFPENVNYRNFERDIDARELLKIHRDLIKDVKCYDIRETIENRLEEFIKNMIRFLENKAAVSRNKDKIDDLNNTDKVSEGEKNG